MQFIDFKTQLKEFYVFSIKDINKLYPSFHKQRLSEWQRKGYIIKIRQGFYIFSDFKIEEKILYKIANRIYDPSYISMETALATYHIIPESVYSITSVTTQRARKLNTPIGNFIYRHVSPSLLFGYKLINYNNQVFQIAELEKALLDFLYFNSSLKDNIAFEGVRFNVDELNKNIDVKKFNVYLKAFNNEPLTVRAENFIAYINNQNNI